MEIKQSLNVSGCTWLNILFLMQCLLVIALETALKNTMPHCL